MPIISSNKTIFKNTMMLYFRQILTLGVSLYTIRVVLDVLGVEDYGIYNVVGGIVMFFSFLKGSMASATQRFFSYAIGESNADKLNKIFSVNLIIYLLIAILSILLLEIVGFWFVKYQLNVPAERLSAAITIYHLSVVSFFFTILSTPFNSAILAHEDMHVYAYLSIVEAIMKLVIVFLLVYLGGDKLILYGELMLATSIIVCFLYGWISIKRYKECQLSKFYWDKNLFKEIVGFTGWTLFGQFTTASRNQAVVVLLNQFFNPVVVAATSIAKNIATQIQLFSNNFNSSLYPPIIKSYAIKDLKNMYLLIYNGSKITFFLMWIFALPFLLEMETILGLWLKEVPPGALLFTRLALIEVLINTISMPLQTAARAPGRMKSYELILGTIQIGIFLISWYLLTLGSPAYIVFVVAIVANLVMFLVRLIIVHSLVGLPIQAFLINVGARVLGVVLISTLLSLTLKSFLPASILYSIVMILFSVIVVSICIYFFGLNKLWRNKLKTMLLNKLPIIKA
jgi:O-antigen/teichoic acid export membrane protein